MGFSGALPGMLPAGGVTLHAEVQETGGEVLVHAHSLDFTCFQCLKNLENLEWFGNVVFNQGT